MINKGEKLTMVSVQYNGRTKTAFVKARINDAGKSVVPYKVVDRLFEKMCGYVNNRGLTITIG